jgi:thiamine transporter ThiT
VQGGVSFGVGSLFLQQLKQKQYAKIAISVSFSKSLVKYYFHFLGVFLWWTLRFEQRFKMPWKALIYCVSDFC